jgi:hypothetical protein
MKITRRQISKIIRETLTESVTAESARIGRELNNIPRKALSSVKGDFSKLGAEVDRSQEKIFVDIFLAYMDQEIAKIDQKYGLSPDQEHGSADKAKARYQEILDDPNTLTAEIAEAIKPFMRLLGKYSGYIEMGIK